MRMLFEEELTTKVLLGRIKKEIKEFQLEKAIDNLENFNQARKKVLTRCDIAFLNNEKI